MINPARPLAAGSIRLGQIVTVKPQKLLGRPEPASARVTERCQNLKFFRVAFPDGTRGTIHYEDME